MEKRARGHFERAKGHFFGSSPDVRDPSHQRMRTVPRGELKMGFLGKVPFLRNENSFFSF